MREVKTEIRGAYVGTLLLYMSTQHGAQGLVQQVCGSVVVGYAEPALLEDNSGIAVQFERTGYFYKDPDSTPDRFVFNKTTALKDSFKF